MEKKFSTVEAIRFGFYTVIENILFFLGLWLSSVFFIISAGFLGTLVAYFPFLNSIIIFFKENDSTIMNTLMIPKEYWQLDIRDSSALFGATILWFIIMQVLYRLISLGVTRINLDFYDYKTSSMKQLFSGFSLLFKGFIAHILYSCLVGLGTCFFIIPGIYFAIKYGFYEQILVDKKTGIIESFKQSSEITYGSRWAIFGLLFIFVCVNLVAMFFLGLGLLITAPAFLLAFTFVYRKLNAAPMVKENAPS